METSSGVNFIKDIIRVFPIYLEEQVGLTVSYTKSKLKSRLDNNQIKVIIQLDFETMVKEINTDKNIFTKEELSKLTEMQNNYVIEIMKKATNYSIYNGRDILQIARLIQNQHVKKWRDYEENWNSTISEIQYEFDVNSMISKSFILSNERNARD